MATYSSSSRYSLAEGGTSAFRKSEKATNYTPYITKDGDTFERIAARLFNDGKRWWEIADINPQVQFPDPIPVGTVIRIPR